MAPQKQKKQKLLTKKNEDHSNTKQVPKKRNAITKQGARRHLLKSPPSREPIVPNKVRRRPSPAARRPSAVIRGGEQSSTTKAASMSNGRKKKGRPQPALNVVVDNRNKISTPGHQHHHSFLEREAEEESFVAVSSSLAKKKKKDVHRGLVDNQKGKTKKNLRLVGSSTSTKSSPERKGQYHRGPNKNKARLLGFEKLSTSKQPKKEKTSSIPLALPTNYVGGKKKTITASAKKINSTKNNGSKKKINMKKINDDQISDILSPSRPKRKASLDAHSAMVALTLQMQRPVLKKSIDSELISNRKRKISGQGNVDHATASATMPKYLAGQDKIKPIASPTSKKKNLTNEKKEKINPKSKKSKKFDTNIDYQEPIPAQQQMPTYSHPIQCTCQSPPVCPLHYQLHCACPPYHQYHHHHHTSMVAPVPTAMAIVGGTSSTSSTSASSTGGALISSIFPFQTTTPSSLVTGVVPVAASISHYSHSQPTTWPSSAWAFPTAAHMLAANGSVSSGDVQSAAAAISGFPAVFQGHLFIRPAHLQLNPTTSATTNSQESSNANFNPASLFVSTTSSPIGGSDLTLHPPAAHQLLFQRHPSPPLSVVGSAVESGCCGADIPDFSTNLISNNSEMVASKNHVCELINETVDMTASAMKSTKKTKSIDKCHGRKSPPKNKKKQRRSKKISIDELLASPSSNLATSSWEPVGASCRKYVYVNNDAKPVRRVCFGAIRHKYEGEIIRVRDCVVIKSDNNYSQNINDENSVSTKRSFVGKIADFFLNPKGVLMASLVWYYWPEQAKVTSPEDLYVFEKAHPKELLASRHIDCVLVDSIEDVAYVITFNEYNRYVSENKSESLLVPSSIIDESAPRAWASYPRRRLMPAEDTDDAMVYFCRRVYDFHGKRLIRNPSF